MTTPTITHLSAPDACSHYMITMADLTKLRDAALVCFGFRLDRATEEHFIYYIQELDALHMDDPASPASLLLDA